jgi:hypothetical protein
MSRDVMVGLGVVVEEVGEEVEEEVMGEVEVGTQEDVEGVEEGVGLDIERFRILKIERRSKGNKEASGTFGKYKARLMKSHDYHTFGNIRTLANSQILSHNDILSINKRLNPDHSFFQSLCNVARTE